MIDIGLTLSTQPPARSLPADIPSGWRGLERVLLTILDRYRVPRRSALEFGVEYGFSTVALSNYFLAVVGVDHFKGDEHAGFAPSSSDRFCETAARLRPYPNIKLLPCSWQEFIHDAAPNTHYDLIHVDAKHDFYTTYVLGTWAAQHSDCVLVHDSLYFPDVAPACDRVAAENGMTAYNFPESNGLGILVRDAEAQ